METAKKVLFAGSWDREFRVQGFGVWGLGFRVQGLGLRV